MNQKKEGKQEIKDANGASSLLVIRYLDPDFDEYYENAVVIRVAGHERFKVELYVDGHSHGDSWLYMDNDEAQEMAEKRARELGKEYDCPIFRVR